VQGRVGHGRLSAVPAAERSIHPPTEHLATWPDGQTRVYIGVPQTRASRVSTQQRCLTTCHSLIHRRTLEAASQYGPLTTTASRQNSHRTVQTVPSLVHPHHTLSSSFSKRVLLLYGYCPYGSMHIRLIIIIYLLHSAQLGNMLVGFDVYL